MSVDKFKVLILTDSLSLPRSYSNGFVRYNQTYVSLLKKANPEIDFIHVGIGGATITRLLELTRYYIYAEPHLVILHCGIVDCAPRALSEFELQLFGKLKLLRFIKPFTTFLRRYRGLTYTNIRLFTETLIKIRDSFKTSSFITVGILPSCNEYEAITPGITRNIARYNAVLEENTNYIDNKKFPRDGIIDDHHHLSEEGHLEIFHKLQIVIKDTFS